MPHPAFINDLVLLFALTFALYRVGDIWTFQVVLFALWPTVRTEDFPSNQQKHFRSIFGVIFVPMGLSALGAVLLWFFPPAHAPRWSLVSALALQGILFLSLAVLGSSATSNRTRGQSAAIDERTYFGPLDTSGESHALRRGGALAGLDQTPAGINGITNRVRPPAFSSLPDRTRYARQDRRPVLLRPGLRLRG